MRAAGVFIFFDLILNDILKRLACSVLKLAYLMLILVKYNPYIYKYMREYSLAIKFFAMCHKRMIMRQHCANVYLKKFPCLI